MLVCVPLLMSWACAESGLPKVPRIPVAAVPVVVPVHATAPVPTVLSIVPRAKWDPTPRAVGVLYRGRLGDIYRTIVIHHSDFIDPPGPLAIKDYHVEVSRFGDIGYHFVIGKDGSVYEARSLTRMGAHAGATREAARGTGRDLDPDWGAIGICLDGLFDEKLPPPAQLAALALLVDDLKKRFPRIDRVIGHREVRAGVEGRGLHAIGPPTACPGERLFRWLDAGGLAATPTP